MALIPKIDMDFQQDGLRIYDTTGRYLLDTNAEGWGSPNIDYANIVSAVVKVLNENSEESAEYTLDYSTVDGTPEIITFGPFEKDFKDGRFEVILTLTDDSDQVYTAKLCKAFFPNIQCCIDKAVTKVIDLEDDHYYMKRINQLVATYDALCMSAHCMNLKQIDNWLKKLQNICEPCVNA